MAMREILFRGKRLDNGEWIEGAFLNDRDGAFYICNAVSDITYGDNGNRRRIGCWYRVDHATVGQYTGLTDKNGKRIFEGDIVLTPERYTNIVGFDGFGFAYLDVSAYDWEQISGFVCPEEILGTWEVIGNIHDNPELLEVSENE